MVMIVSGKQVIAVEIVQLAATAGAAAALAGLSLLSLARPPTGPGASLLSDGALFAGWAVFLNLVYPWHTLGYHVRWATLGLFGLVALARAADAVRTTAAGKERLRFRVSDWLKVTAAVILAVVLPVSAVRHPPIETAAIASPFAEGTWYVGQGGASPLVNHHHSVPAQRYSIDLVRVDGKGRSWSGSAGRLQSYHAWGSSVVAPAAGSVLVVVDGLPEPEIGTRDTENPAGNHIILELPGDVRLLVGHLQCGSVEVQEGQTVDTGDFLARVGNSGSSSEPHLHIQAMRMTEDYTWVSMPMEIDGNVLHRGQLLRHGD